MPRLPTRGSRVSRALWACAVVVGQRLAADKVLDVDEAVAALRDPTGGRGANGDITRQLENGGTVGEKGLKSAV